MKLSEYDPLDGRTKEASKEFQISLEKYPVHLSYQDGNIAEICLTGDDPTWVVNVKRGIISLLQNNLKNSKGNHTVTEVECL